MYILCNDWKYYLGKNVLLPEIEKVRCCSKHVLALQVPMRIDK